MAQTLSASSVVELTMHSVYQGQVVLNVFHYFNKTGVPLVDGDGELTNLINLFYGLIWNPPLGNGLQDYLSPGFELQYITAQQVNPQRQYYVYVPFNEAGLAVGDGVPSDTNMTVSFRTDRAIRGSTGNKKFTGFVVGMFNGNAWNPSIITAINGLQSAFLTTFDDVGGTSTWQPTVWSNQRPGDRSTIVGTVARDQVRVLRRRQLRLGV